MTGIDAIGGPAGGGPAGADRGRRGRAASESRFVLPDATAAADTAPLTETFPAAAILRLQEDWANLDLTGPADPPPWQRQSAAMLSELGMLQRGLLGGGDPAAAVTRLDALLEQPVGALSPPVLALLSAVRLRVRVELARYRQ